MYIKFNATVISIEIWYWVTVNDCWRVWGDFFSLSFSITSSASTTFFYFTLLPFSLSLCPFSLQERIIERLKEQREREEREKGDEVESSKKELKELREKVSQLQAELADREVEDTLRNSKTHIHICAKSQKNTLSLLPRCAPVKKMWLIYHCRADLESSQTSFAEGQRWNIHVSLTTKSKAHDQKKQRSEQNFSRCDLCDSYKNTSAEAETDKHRQRRSILFSVLFTLQHNTMKVTINHFVKVRLKGDTPAALEQSEAQHLGRHYRFTPAPNLLFSLYMMEDKETHKRSPLGKTNLLT